MHFTPTKTTLATLGLVACAQAHTMLTNLFVDGVDQGRGVCIRMDTERGKGSYPIADIESTDMACGRDGELGVARVCPVKAGGSLTVQFRASASTPGSKFISSGHKGPCAFYMKKVDSAIADNNAAGDGWFKIGQDSSVDEATDSWCTSRMIETDGMMTFDVPSDLERGYYLVRTELLALHKASKGDPQFFVNCAQIYVEGSGTARPETVTIPDNYVDLSMPAMNYDIWKKPLQLPYPMFGPEPYQSVGSPTGQENATDNASEDGEEDSFSDDDCESTEGPIENPAEDPTEYAGGELEGAKPEGCIMENGNWCGFEVPAYDDAESCRVSTKDCRDQAKDCHESAPAIGIANCKLWRLKCDEIKASCENEVFPGPPNAGKDLTPVSNTSAENASKLVTRDTKAMTYLLRRGFRNRSE